MISGNAYIHWSFLLQRVATKKGHGTFGTVTQTGKAAPRTQPQFWQTRTPVFIANLPRKPICALRGQGKRGPDQKQVMTVQKAHPWTLKALANPSCTNPEPNPNLRTPERAWTRKLTNAKRGQESNLWLVRMWTSQKHG